MSLHLYARGVSIERGLRHSLQHPGRPTGRVHHLGQHGNCRLPKISDVHEHSQAMKTNRFWEKCKHLLHRQVSRHHCAVTDSLSMLMKVHAEQDKHQYTSHSASQIMLTCRALKRGCRAGRPVKGTRGPNEACARLAVAVASR